VNSAGEFIAGNVNTRDDRCRSFALRRPLIRLFIWINTTTRLANDHTPVDVQRPVSTSCIADADGGRNETNPYDFQSDETGCLSTRRRPEDDVS
jgi:hypothetical protein